MALTTHHLRRAVERDFEARMLQGGLMTLGEARGLAVHRPRSLVAFAEALPCPGPQAASRHAVVGREGFGGGFPRWRGAWSTDPRPLRRPA